MTEVLSPSNGVTHSPKLKNGIMESNGKRRTSDSGKHQENSTPGGPVDTPSRVRVHFAELEQPSPVHQSITKTSPTLKASLTESDGVMDASLTIVDEFEENPFRPDGDLSFEVEPIVQHYKHRHWHASLTDDRSPPASPSKCCDDKHCSIGNTTDCGDASFQVSSNCTITHNHHHHNGHSDVCNGSPITTSQTASLLKQNGNSSSNNSTKKGKSGTAEVTHRTLLSPKAGIVEVVHLDSDLKKKKCGCCSIQ